MSVGTIAPVGKHQFFDDNGDPLSAGKVYTYEAGTSTPKATYSDTDLTTPNANPIVLDAAGRATIFLSASSYKFVVKTSADATIYTQDNIQAVNAGASGLGEIFDFGGSSSSPVTGTSYPAGATFDKLHPGTAVYNEDAANLSGTYKLEATGVVAAATTLTVALVNLSDGAPDTPLVTMTFTSTTGERKQSSAITFPAGGTAKNYGIKVKVDAGSGYVWGVKLVRTA